MRVCEGSSCASGSTPLPSLHGEKGARKHCTRGLHSFRYAFPNRNIRNGVPRLRTKNQKGSRDGSVSRRLYTGLQHHLQFGSARMRLSSQNESAKSEMGIQEGSDGRTAEIPQRHSPTSMATLRKRIANAVTPWFLAAFPARPRRQTTQTQTDAAPVLANETGG